MSPTALTAISAATRMPPGSSMSAVPMPPFMERPGPASLPTVAPAPRADAPFGDRRVAGGARGAVAAVRRGPDGGVAANPQVVQDGRRDDWHPGGLRLIPDAAVFQVAHHALGGRQTERAAARQHDRMHLLDRIGGVEERRLARAGRRPPDVDRRGRACLGEHYRAAGGALGQRVVTDLEPVDRRQPAVAGRRPRRVRRHTEPPSRKHAADDYPHRNAVPKAPRIVSEKPPQRPAVRGETPRRTEIGQAPG